MSAVRVGELHRITSVRRAAKTTHAAIPRLAPLNGEIVFATDLWVLVAVLWGARLATGTLHPAVIAFGISLGLLLAAAQSDRKKLVGSALDDIGMILPRVWLAYSFASGASLLAGWGGPKMALAVALAAGPALMLGRVVSHALERWRRRHGPRPRALVIGAGDIARNVICNLSSHDEYGLEVVGAVDDDPKLDTKELGTCVVGTTDQISELVSSLGIQVVIVAFSAGHQGKIVDALRAAMLHGTSVWVVPRLFELGAAGPAAENLWDIPLVPLELPPRYRRQWVAKRALDVAVSTVGLVLGAPLLALLAALIVLESGRPILLRQRRVGVDERPFDILKFRTMRPADPNVEGTEWKADEDRITRVGRVLRKTSLDELPQLFNVLKGEMSLVGPRPERPHFVNRFTASNPKYFLRHRVPAGMTGWAQIHGLKGDGTSIEDRAAFDNYYIEHWSLAKDLKILLRTPAKLVTKSESR